MLVSRAAACQGGDEEALAGADVGAGLGGRAGSTRAPPASLIEDWALSRPAACVLQLRRVPRAHAAAPNPAGRRGPPQPQVALNTKPRHGLARGYLPLQRRGAAEALCAGSAKLPGPAGVPLSPALPGTTPAPCYRQQRKQAHLPGCGAR